MRRLFMLASLALVACSSSNETPPCNFSFHQQVSGNVSTVVGPFGDERTSLNDRTAPDFHWMRDDGTLDSLSAHQGQVVLLNFWAAWCGPCKAEMPDIQAVANQMGDSIFVIGVSVDNCGDAFGTVKDYVRSHNITYQIALDSNWYFFNRYWLYNSWNLPQSFFLFPDGRISEEPAGVLTRDQIVQEIRKAQK